MVDRSELDPIGQQVFDKVITVRDPEFGRSIGERGLIDEIRVEGDTAYITYHLTVPFCPDVFALYIGTEIKKKALEVEGINKAVVTLKDHLKAAELTKRLQENET